MAKKKTTRRKATTKKAAKKAGTKKTAKKAPRRAADPAREAPLAPPAPAPRPDNRSPRTREMAIDLARALDETNCRDVIVLDLLGLSQVWDYLVVGSGTSERQMRTALDRAEEAAHRLGERPFGGHRDRSPTWMALDFVDVAVHVFEPATRGTYDLELLWGDAPRIDWASGAPRRRTLPGAGDAAED